MDHDVSGCGRVNSDSLVQTGFPLDTSEFDSDRLVDVRQRVKSTHTRL